MSDPFTPPLPIPAIATLVEVGGVITLTVVETHKEHTGHRIFTIQPGGLASLVEDGVTVLRRIVQRQPLLSPNSCTSPLPANEALEHRDQARA